MSYWSVVQTQTRREEAVEGRLIRIGFETYLPKIKIRTEIAPYLPGYLFVRIIDRFYPVRWTEGVIRMLPTCDQPTLEKYLAETRKKERKGFIPATLPRLKPGQKVRVIRGSFAGQIAECEGLSARDRVWILLDLLGQKASVELSDRDLEPLPVVR